MIMTHNVWFMSFSPPLTKVENGKVYSAYYLKRPQDKDILFLGYYKSKLGLIALLTGMVPNPLPTPWDK